MKLWIISSILKTIQPVEVHWMNIYIIKKLILVLMQNFGSFIFLQPQKLMLLNIFEISD